MVYLKKSFWSQVSNFHVEPSMFRNAIYLFECFYNNLIFKWRPKLERKKIENTQSSIKAKLHVIRKSKAKHVTVCVAPD